MQRIISLTLAFLITANFAHASSWLESKEVFPKGAPNHDVVCDDLTKITDKKARAYVLNVAHALASAIPGAPRYNYREVWANDGYFNLLKEIIPHVCWLAVVSVTNDNFDRNCQAMYKDTKDSINWHTGKMEVSADSPYAGYLQYLAAYVISYQWPGSPLPSYASKDSNFSKLKHALRQVKADRLPFVTRAMIEMARIDPAFECVDGLAPTRYEFVVQLSEVPVDVYVLAKELYQHRDFRFPGVDNVFTFLNLTVLPASWLQCIKDGALSSKEKYNKFLAKTLPGEEYRAVLRARLAQIAQEIHHEPTNYFPTVEALTNWPNAVRLKAGTSYLMLRHKLKPIDVNSLPLKCSGISEMGWFQRTPPQIDEALGLASQLFEGVKFQMGADVDGILCLIADEMARDRQPSELKQPEIIATYNALARKMTIEDSSDHLKLTAYLMLISMAPDDYAEWALALETLVKYFPVSPEHAVPYCKENSGRILSQEDGLQKAAEMVRTVKNPTTWVFLKLFDYFHHYDEKKLTRVKRIVAGRQLDNDRKFIVVDRLAKTDHLSLDECEKFFGPLCDIYTAEEVTVFNVNYGEVPQLLYYLPPDQRHVVLKYLQSKIERHIRIGHGLIYEPHNTIIPFVQAATLEDAGCIYAYWTHILQTCQDEQKLRFLSNCIMRYAERLNLHELHPLLNHAITVGIQLDNAADPRSPVRAMRIMRQKREVPVDWVALQPLIDKLVADMGGFYVRLNPQGIKAFTAQMALDLGSVPTVTQGEWIEMLDALLTVMRDDPKLEEDGNRRIKDMTDSRGKPRNETICQVIDYAKNPENFYCSSIRMPVESLQGSRMKCVIKSLLRLPAGPDKWMRLLQFLAGVGGDSVCGFGKNEAVESNYRGLHPAFRIQTRVQAFDIHPHEALVLQALSTAVQDALKWPFNDDSLFMKKVCFFDPENPNKDLMMYEMAQGVHNVAWVQGAILDEIGGEHESKFDIHSQAIYPRILDMPRQEMMVDYYTLLDFKGFVNLVHGFFNKLYVEAFAGKSTDMYKGIERIFGAEELSELMEMDEFGEKCTGLELAGIVKLMIRQKLLVEVERPLLPPEWGN